MSNLKYVDILLIQILAVGELPYGILLYVDPVRHKIWFTSSFLDHDSSIEIDTCTVLFRPGRRRYAVIVKVMGSRIVRCLIKVSVLTMLCRPHVC